MSNTLLPCPFCGGEVKLMAIAGEPYPHTYEVDIANTTVESDDICYVHCPTCGANWHIELRIDAFPLKTIAAWNRRADAVKVVRGVWKMDTDPDDGDCRCSNCLACIDALHRRNHGVLNALGYKLHTFYKYCPNCGAKMEANQDE